MSIYADMYPDEWTPPCPHEEQAAELWLEWKNQHDTEPLKA